MIKAYKVIVIILFVLFAMMICSCKLEEAKKSEDVLPDNDHTQDVTIGETDSESTVSDDPEKEAESASTSESEPSSENEDNIVNLDDLQFDTYPLDKDISYDSDAVSVEVNETFDETNGETKYIFTVTNISDDIIEVANVVATHAYIGNGEWIGVSIGDFTLDLFIIAPGESCKIQYYPPELPEGAYRMLGSFCVSDTGEEEYFFLTQ